MKNLDNQELNDIYRVFELYNSKELALVYSYKFKSVPNKIRHEEDLHKLNINLFSELYSFMNNKMPKILNCYKRKIIVDLKIKNTGDILPIIK